MKRLWMPVIVLVAILMGIGFLLLEPVSNSTGVQYEERAKDNANGPIQQLQTATNGEVTVSTDPYTGRVLFVGTEPSSPIPQPASLSPDADAEEAARGFLSEYGQLFGVTDQASQLAAAKTSETEDGRSFVRFQQLYQGVPVVGGELIVQVSSKGHSILSANGEIATTMSVDTAATVSTSDAKATALGVVSKEYGCVATALRVGEPQLWIYNPSILGMNQDRSSLVWRMDVESADGLPIRELVLVDAHLGFVALHFNQMDTAKSRMVYDAGCTSTLPGSLVRSEGDPATGNADADNAYDYTGYTYDFYSTNHGRDSIDDAGMTIISTINYDPDGGCDFENAGWDGSQMIFGTGYASACDVVAHELTHGVTDYESQLFYYMQSGAINEAFSDIWGEFTELTYNPGSSSDRWLLGEDLPVGAIRDMQDPTVYGDPDRMTSPNYVCGGYSYDYGGVHFNSGVANKAAYLMVDGDTFNGHVVTGMGIAKTADLFYEVQTNLLTSASDYADLYDALQQAATNLGYNAADRQTVKDAIDAVEMNQQPTSCPATEAPILESGTPHILFSDDLENLSSGNWVSGSLSGSDQWYFASGYATSGQYSLWGYDYYDIADYYMAMTSDVALPASSQPYMHFKHSFEFDYLSSTYYDGGVVEYSTNGGSSWLDAEALFTHNGYTGIIGDLEGNPLAYRDAFVGYSSGYISSRLDLSSLAGQSVRFRFRIGTGSNFGALGWFIDDILIYTPEAPVEVTISTSGLVSYYPATVHFVQAGAPQTATTYGPWSDNVDYNSTVSIDSSVAVSTTERYGTNAVTSWTANETATYMVPYYHQFKPVVSAVTGGTGHTDLGITNSATLTYTRFGAAGTSSIFDSQSFNAWVDIGSTVSLSSSSSASTATHRWYASGTTSWTVNDASSRSATYWEQFKPTIYAVTAGTGHADTSDTNYVTLTYTRFGAAGTSNVFDAESFNDWVDMGSTASLSNTSTASTPTHRWYAAGTTSWIVNDAGSQSATYWDQFKPAISVVTAGTGHTDLSSTNSVTLTYTRFGAAGTSSVFDGQSFSDWVDVGSTASLSSTSTASTPTQRWYAPGPTFWVVNDATSRAATYWDQLMPAITVATAGTGHTDLSSTNFATLTYSRFGAAGTLSVFDAQSFNDWVDTGSTASLSNPSSGSTSTHRWYSPLTASWAVNDASSRSATYWDQLKPTISVVTSGNGHTDLDGTNCATLTYSRCGVAGTSSVFDGQSFNDWLDIGSTASLSSPSSGSTSTHRWYAPGTTSWAVNDTGSNSATYWEQFKATVALTGLSSSHPATISVVRGGITDTTPASAIWSDWADRSSTLSTSRLVAVSAEERYSTAGTTSWTTGLDMEVGVDYVHQFLATIEITGPSQSHPTTLVFVKDGVPESLSLSDTWSDWVDADSALSIGKSIEGGWVGDWSTGGATSWTVSSPVSATVHYKRSYVGIYLLVGALLLVAMMIGAGTFFLLRRKREAA
jgi:Zn-dependent metalloprotease